MALHKDPNAKIRRAHNIAAARNAPVTQQPVLPRPNIAPVRSALLDYLSNQGTCTCHPFHTAIENNVLTYGDLIGPAFKFPKDAIDTLQNYALITNPKNRREINLDLSR